MGLLEKLLPPCSPDAFAQDLIKRIRKLGILPSAEYNRENFSLALGPAGTVFLANVYAEYCAATLQKRGRVLRRFAESIGSPATIPLALADVRAHLLPRVRDRFYDEVVALTFQAQEQAPPSLVARRLNEHLVVGLVYDQPGSVAMIPVSALKKWGISGDEALAIARENLWKISDEDFLEPSPGLFVGPWTDNHAASRLFLHELIWRLPVKGKPVAMIPNRDTLLIAGSEDEAALLAMAARAGETLSQPRFMLAYAFELTDAGFQSFLPPEDSAVHSAFAALHHATLSRLCNEQKPLLDALTKLRGGDKTAPPPATAAMVTLARAPSGELTTLAIWGDGMTWLLPEVDTIVFMAMVDGKPKQLVQAGFSDMRDELEELLEPTKHYPPRWKTKGFPTADQLARLSR